MTISDIPFPQPQLDPTGITLDQYEAYTPEKLELLGGFYNYSGQNMKGFYLAVLANMGIREAVHEVPISLWLEALVDRLSQQPDLIDSDVGKAMLNRLNRGIDDLKAVAEYIESKSR